MHVKVFHLNIFQGKFIDRVIDFVRENNIDLLHFQEVSNGKMSKGGKYKYPRDIGIDNQKGVVYDTVGINCVEEVKRALNLNAEVVHAIGYKGDPDSFEGNATFYNNRFKVIQKEVVWLKDYMEIEEGFTDTANLSRAALITRFSIEGKSLTSINAHFAWGPNAEDEQYKVDQARKLLDRFQSIEKPFIFTGDFNVSQHTKTASIFDAIGRNLAKEYKVQNTLNERVHPAKVFPPGLAVDYAFASEDIIVKSFRIVDEVDLSDHFGILLEIEF